RVAGNAVAPLAANFGIDEQAGLARFVGGFDRENVGPPADDAVQVKEETFGASPLPDLLTIHPQHEFVVASDDRRAGGRLVGFVFFAKPDLARRRRFGRVPLVEPDPFGVDRWLRPGRFSQSDKNADRQPRTETKATHFHSSSTGWN